MVGMLVFKDDVETVSEGEGQLSEESLVTGGTSIEKSVGLLLELSLSTVITRPSPVDAYGGDRRELEPTTLPEQCASELGEVKQSKLPPELCEDEQINEDVRLLGMREDVTGESMELEFESKWADVTLHGEGGVGQSLISLSPTTSTSTSTSSSSEHSWESREFVSSSPSSRALFGAGG
jgi:hypothetical protein